MQFRDVVVLAAFGPLAVRPETDAFNVAGKGFFLKKSGSEHCEDATFSDAVKIFFVVRFCPLNELFGVHLNHV